MIKKAQVNVIVIILIVLIALVAVVIVWNIVGSLVKEKSSEVDIGRFAVGLEIKDIVLFENEVSTIKVNRGPGDEELDGLNFIFYDQEGNSVIREAEAINELETKTYSFSAIPEIGKIEKIGVAPIINGKLGMVVESEPDEVLKVPSGVVSWWRFDDLTDFIGGNTCEVIGGEIINGVLINKGIIDGVLNGEISCLANGLDLREMAISFWVKGNKDKTIIAKAKGYEIGIENKLLKFVFGSRQEVSEVELDEGWNHIVVSISSAVSKIYVNKEVKQITLDSFYAGNEKLIIKGEVDEVMIFNKPITNIEGIYDVQKKD
jgi:flagellar basal body-associated protein FliL